MAVNVVIASNLGSEFDLGQQEAGKIHLKIDGTSLQRDNVTGKLSAIGQTIDGVLSEGHNIANVKDASGNTIANIKETVIAVSQSLNGISITKEDGTVTSITKVSTTSLVVDPTAKTLKSVVNGVESTAVDISALYADTNLIFDSYENYVLTFHKEDNTPVTINLEDLLPVVVEDSSTARVTGDGTSSNPLSVDVKISKAGGNILDVDAEGLIAKIKLTETDTVSLTGDGKFTPIRADVKISSDAGNAVTQQEDGLYVPTVAQKGLQASTSGIVIDEFGNDYTVGITLADEGGNMLTQGVAGLKASLNKQNSDTISFSGNGGNAIAGGGFGGGTPLTANVRIKDASMSNILKSTVDGLTAEIISTSSETADISGSGTNSSPLQVDVKISQAAGNLLEDNGGLRVSETAVLALASIEVQDAFGTPIYRAFPV